MGGRRRQRPSVTALVYRTSTSRSSGASTPAGAPIIADISGSAAALVGVARLGGVRNDTPAPVITTVINPETLPNAAPPAAPREEQARARGWSGPAAGAPQGVDWVPAPDRPDCALPPSLVAWCRTAAAEARLHLAPPSGGNAEIIPGLVRGAARPALHSKCSGEGGAIGNRYQISGRDYQAGRPATLHLPWVCGYKDL